jgi:biopolymer transport protein ExbB/TolQ
MRVHTESLLELINRGGFTIYILILCSILSLKIAIDKFMQFRGLKGPQVDKILDAVKIMIIKKDYNTALQELEELQWKKFGIGYTNPLKEVIRYIIINREVSKEELLDLSFGKLDKELVRFEKGLNVHATLGAITPFIGLFGTVIGIIKSFSALSLQNQSNYASVISGIAEALVATAGGLFVAIPSVMFYNYFTKKLKLQVPLFDAAIHELIWLIKR